jgi:hypothetical protein
MIYVTAVPHPNAREMRRTTFVCYPCNRTWTYALSPEMAAAYASHDPIGTASKAPRQLAAR